MPELLLFGGSGHEDFLGCLTCGEIETRSVWNPVGHYGSYSSSKSVWNAFSQYGDESNPLSPWNEFSESAPAVTDRDGRFYGYFSVNEGHPERTQVEFLVLILDNDEWVRDNLDKVRAAMASNRTTRPLGQEPDARGPFLSKWAYAYKKLKDVSRPAAVPKAASEDSTTAAENTIPAPIAENLRRNSYIGNFSRPASFAISLAEQADRYKRSTDGRVPAQKARPGDSGTAKRNDPTSSLTIEGVVIAEKLRRSSYFGNFSPQLPFAVVSDRSDSPKAAVQDRAGPFVMLKDGSRLDGALQKYENGLAYVLVWNRRGTKLILATIPRSQIHEAGTAEAQQLHRR